MEKRNLVRESEEIAWKIIRRKFRLTLARYYLLWSTLPIIFSLIYSVIPYSSDLYYVVTPVVYVPYFLFTTVLFRRAYNVYRRLVLSGSERSISRSGKVDWFSLEFALITLIYVIAFGLIYYGVATSTVVFTIVGGVIFGVMLLWGFMSAIRLTGRLRYYDVVAVITLFFTIVALFIPFSNVNLLIYYAFSLSWIFAGYASFMEVQNSE
ncbi:hypothetical protein HS7_00630 [Sulfolobales archaeon HS-7]|nr:hypothetical protein HS7_00630 [Sulfolobales archaeon HS-7]